MSTFDNLFIDKVVCPIPFKKRHICLQDFHITNFHRDGRCFFVSSKGELFLMQNDKGEPLELDFIREELAFDKDISKFLVRTHYSGEIKTFDFISGKLVNISLDFSDGVLTT